MAKSNYVNIFDLEGAYAGGGEFFKDGRYKVEEGGACFTLFDFNGKAKKGEEAPALCLELQALDENGKALGEPKPQFWPIRGEGVEMVNPIKGRKGAFASLTMTGQYDTLMKGGEFYMFMEHLRKAEFDMDQYDNDVTVLEGLDATFGKTPDPYERKKVEDDDGKKKKDYGPRMIVVVTEVTQERKGSGKSSDKSESKSKTKEEDTSKTTSRSNKKSKSAEDMTAQEILLKYIEDELDGAKEKENTTRPLLRMEMGKWITGELQLDAEKAREVQGLVNDDDELKAALDSFGWKLKGKEIIPPSE